MKKVLKNSNILSVESTSNAIENNHCYVREKNITDWRLFKSPSIAAFHTREFGN